MEVTIEMTGNMEFVRSTKSPDRGQIKMMGATVFVNDVPDTVSNGPVNQVTVSGNFWNDGSLRVKNWLTNGATSKKGDA